MKKLLLILFVTTCLSGYSQAPKKVLFIGNSITYFNDMPILFENIANDKGKNVDTEMYAPGGTGFVNHHLDNNVYDLFQNNVWDMVVLQPGTGESAGVSWPVNTTIERGNKLQDSIKKYSPCAKIFLYEIPYGVPSETTYGTYFQVQTQMKDSVTKMADNMDVPLVAAGECARFHYNTQQDLLLHNSYNDVHPNLNGSYLTACAMYCTLFQEPVTGTTSYGGVNQVTAEYFHSIADNIILNNKPQWRINTYNLHSEFSLLLNESLVSLTNQSTNYTSLLWDFGDGITSTDLNPQHNYTSTGTKTITLTVFRNGCSESFTKIITINSLHTNSFEKEVIKIYPTITSDELTIESNDNLNFEITSITGQKIGTFYKNSKTYKLDVSQLANSIYFLKYDNKTYKFIKK